jgi:hypothetical protein
MNMKYELRRLPRTGLPVLTDADGNVVPGQTQVIVSHEAKHTHTVAVTFLLAKQGLGELPEGVTSALDKEANL